MYANDWKSVQDWWRHEDRNLNVRFYWTMTEDGPATLREGRKIEVPEERVHIVSPANREGDVSPRAHAEWKRIGEDVVTYAMRFEDQYRRFRADEQQVVTGAPVAEVAFLDGSQKATLKALGVHTVEQLAALSGQALRNLGAGGMAWQQAAEKYLKASKDGAEVTNLVRENAALKEAMASMAADGGVDPRVKYAEMPDGDLKDLIKERTGEFPRGNPSRTTLIRMLVENDRKPAPVETQAAA